MIEYSLFVPYVVNHEHLYHVVHPVFYGLQGPVRGFFDLWFYRGCALGQS